MIYQPTFFTHAHTKRWHANAIAKKRVKTKFSELDIGLGIVTKACTETRNSIKFVYTHSSRLSKLLKYVSMTLRPYIGALHKLGT